MNQESELERFNGIMAEFYTALKDDAIERKWKKKAVSLMVGLDHLQRELREGGEVPQAGLEKAVRQAEDLLNQLNRH